MKHSNIATIHALEDVDGVTFIVMEYVEGQPLAARIPPDGMSLKAFFATFILLADALAHAHEHGRIHRDLKPGNIMIAADGTPKILDFGLARILNGADVSEIDSQAPTVTMQVDAPVPQAPVSLTQGRQFLGTPAYMSPEQIERRKVDARSDLFSFGVVMYEAITGQRPFKGDTIESIIGRILTEEPKSVTALRPVTPYLLWQVIRQCLRKSREDRTQTARELYTNLRDVQQETQAGRVLVDAKTIPATSGKPLWRHPATLGLAVATLIIGLIAAWMLKPIPGPPLRKFALTVEPFGSEFYNGPAISPDGTIFVKMEFTLHSFDVYSAEVDDKGIDFVIRRDETCYYDVQVKSARNLSYIFFPKDKFSPRKNLLASIVLFSDNAPPALYLVPSTRWLKPDALFVSRDYQAKKSKPEWGLNLS